MKRNNSSKKLNNIIKSQDMILKRLSENLNKLKELKRKHEIEYSAIWGKLRGLDGDFNDI